MHGFGRTARPCVPTGLLLGPVTAGSSVSPHQPPPWFGTPNRALPSTRRGVPSMEDDESLGHGKWECKYHVTQLGPPTISAFPRFWGTTDIKYTRRIESAGASWTSGSMRGLCFAIG